MLRHFVDLMQVSRIKPKASGDAFEGFLAFLALSKCTDREVARQLSELFKDLMEIVHSMKVAMRAYAVLRPEEHRRLSSHMSITECEEIMREAGLMAG